MCCQGVLRLVPAEFCCQQWLAGWLSPQAGTGSRGDPPLQLQDQAAHARAGAADRAGTWSCSDAGPYLQVPMQDLGPVRVQLQHPLHHSCHLTTSVQGSVLHMTAHMTYVAGLGAAAFTAKAWWHKVSRLPAMV